MKTEDLQRALDRIQKLSAAQCMGVSDRKRVLQEIKTIAENILFLERSGIDSDEYDEGIKITWC